MMKATFIANQAIFQREKMAVTKMSLLAEGSITNTNVSTHNHKS